MELVKTEADIIKEKDSEIAAIRSANNGLRRKIVLMETESADHDVRVNNLLANKEKIISDLAAQLSDARSFIAKMSEKAADEGRKRLEEMEKAAAS